ncbi:SusC/RagA family TonB-linked outer membrane protein [Catalinimonas niigatensis]|uniref:SusC/RagA family TonB-linked outer membrane protein n=1 Tax=Catalinimonas niigatensis TaxID=1397264 RepID=UPI0026669FFB|nr:SusC/RagA family TonB-linked outer membrane protein [Catalinimonas niigatensis]WPP50836.1 SusC/RagA family TonB-linked outer membrane protein [Catalinimonas niigatensis]
MKKPVQKNYNLRSCFQFTALLHFLLLLTAASVQAQEKTVSGTVSSVEEGSLPGVNVLVKGTTTGTVTDMDGNYRITVPASESILVFSSIGYTAEEITVGNQSILNIELLPDIQSLSEVVVTALGIERESQSLGYAIQKLDGEKLNESRETNFTNALAGKVAGLDIRSNTGVGSSTRVILRGESSLSVNGNQPLFVVDGIPISNDINNSTSADYGNAAAEINPADIASVNVLKGPAAAALYGSRAANGAIVITTKSGKNTNGIGISVNSSVTFEDVLRLPQFQNKFGGGSNGLFEGSNFGFQGNLDLYPNGILDGYDESWGPRLDYGPNRAQFDSPTTNGFRGGDVHLPNRGDIIPTPWISQPNNVEDFFEVGQTIFNNVAVSGGNDKGNFRLSLTNLDQNGIVPNNDLVRNTMALNTSYKLTDKFKADLSLSYIKTESENRPDQGYGRNTPMYFILWMTRQVNMNSMRDYWQPGLEGVQQFQYNYGENHNNPFFYQYENTSGQLKDHLLGRVALTYDFTDNLSLMVRTGTDLYNDFRSIRRAVSTVGTEKGSYQESTFYFEERNTDMLLKYDFKSKGKFGAVLSAGANRLDQNRRSNNMLAPELLIPGIYNLGNNGAPLQTNAFSAEKRINSVYGLAQFDYDSKLFLDITGRNDWSSTLPENNNSYFYPSVSFSALFNEIFALPELVDLAQLRLGWAQVGNDTGPYQLLNSFGYELPWGAELALTESATLKNPQLKPESINTYEIGANVQLFKSRLGIDVTYYDIRSKDQILNIPLTETSGYQSRVINAGEIRNRGVELMLTTTPVRLNNSFQWDIMVNFAKNYSEVLSLAEGIDAFVQSAPGEEATLEARVGERMGALYGPGFERVAEGPMTGEIIIGANGLPIKTTEPIYLGNFNPDWTAGITNSFSFKGFYARGLLDIRYGGVFISRFYNKAMGSGILEETGRERGAREPGTEYDGLYYHAGAVQNEDETYSQNLVSTDGTASEGIYGTSARNYYKVYHDHNSESQLFDASYIKLREVAIGYNLPQKLMGRLPFRNVRVSFIGRNLKLWTDNPHFDPETAVATTGGGLIPGFENMSLPSTKSWGFNLSFNL